MIKIDRDYHSGTGDNFKVSISEEGMGRGPAPVRRLSLDAALESVRHYFGVEHNATLCGYCAKRKGKA